MSTPVKPPRLRRGQRVAVVSPSWGGPALFPHVLDAGERVLREELGLDVVEMPHARSAPDALDADPRGRAEDLNAAFAAPDIHAVFASIGGDDSVRILPYLDLDAALARPKVVMGFSDVTTLLAALAVRGLVTFHGPAVMAGFAQARRLPSTFLEHVRAVLFEAPAQVEYRPYPVSCEGYPDWREVATAGEVNPLVPNTTGFRVLQGAVAVEGRLFGGCVEVLEFLKGTRWWPPAEFWPGRILFLETSEEQPSPEAVKRMLRNYGSQGVLDRLAGLLVGRPRGYSLDDRRLLEAHVLKVVRDEFGRADLPVVANVDFGHTDPQLILPLGIRLRVDPVAGRLSLIEPAVA